MATLTKYMREVFVEAAMRDVPTVDYREQYTKLYVASAVGRAPKEVQTLWNDPNTRGWLEKRTVHEYGFAMYMPTVDWSTPEVPTAEDGKVLAKIAALNKAQDEVLKNLRTKLEGVAAACTTIKALREALPEFVKYAPEDTPKAVRSLPVVQNVVADFVKAGWPVKSKKAVAA